jgi:sugar fermentation stimulation protein A
MRLPPLIEGRLLRRYKRFLADVELEDGRIVTAHCANPGAMLGLHAPGSRVWLSENDNPSRKLRYSWHLIEVDFGESAPQLVGIDTSLPNRLAEEAIIAERITELTGYGTLRREVNYGLGSRVDFLLSEPGRPLAYVEVKNVHMMRRPGLVEFPDCVAARSARHMGELGDMVEAGHRAVLLYVIQMAGSAFRVAGDIDPAYAAACVRARARGVEMLAYTCAMALDDITIASRIPIET